MTLSPTSEYARGFNDGTNAAWKELERVQAVKNDEIARLRAKISELENSTLAANVDASR